MARNSRIRLGKEDIPLILSLLTGIASTAVLTFWTKSPFLAMIGIVQVAGTSLVLLQQLRQSAPRNDRSQERYQELLLLIQRHRIEPRAVHCDQFIKGEIDQEALIATVKEAGKVYFIDCRNYSSNTFMHCAVNPMGDCKDCPFYENLLN